ncbi:hypothetical protein [Bacillus sp. FJAT-27245]|uniref:hypothetical protein n=1 Tax=Bacillus sp. FJAT-27245 TaxID=1684144 RepID=UPI0006A7CF90|nr:hypothetical protein [Bacillus sp. FJAT-27245]
MLLRHRIFEEVNLQLVAKLHGANSQMFLEKLIQVAASPRGKRVPRDRQKTACPCDDYSQKPSFLEWKSTAKFNWP